jgi:hypothetical protein
MQEGDRKHSALACAAHMQRSMAWQAGVTNMQGVKACAFAMHIHLLAQLDWL